jgi:acyl-CoA reductase-like NAD-dependent aldehyde dehydrogenase
VPDLRAAGIHDKLVAELGAAVSSLRFAGKRDADNEIGPLISTRQRDRVASFVERALGQPHIERVTGAACIPAPASLPADAAGRLQTGR